MTVVQGGMHVHKGSAVQARACVEADRHRCGDYYLADGEGIPERIVASRGGAVVVAGTLDGEQYEGCYWDCEVRDWLLQLSSPPQRPVGVVR